MNRKYGIIITIYIIWIANRESLRNRKYNSVYCSIKSRVKRFIDVFNSIENYLTFFVFYYVLRFPINFKISFYNVCLCSLLLNWFVFTNYTLFILHKWLRICQKQIEMQMCPKCSWSMRFRDDMHVAVCIIFNRDRYVIVSALDCFLLDHFSVISAKNQIQSTWRGILTLKTLYLLVIARTTL